MHHLIKPDPYAPGYRFRGFHIPHYMLEALNRYIQNGARPGDFLCSVICNDLRAAVGQADEHNLVNLPAYVGYLYNEAPGPCWGSKQNMLEWIRAHEK